MNLQRHVTADAAAGALLLGAAAALLATPYDGGMCRNVAAAYVMPAASSPSAEPPEQPTALADARRALTDARAAVAEVEREGAQVEQARTAATEARSAARRAQSDMWSTPSSTGSSGAWLEESQLDAAERAAEYAADWLAQVEDDVAGSSEYPIWNQSDVDRAQADLDRARQDVADAKAALATAEAEAATQEAAAASAKATADGLDAAADAAEQAASNAAAQHSARESATQTTLQSATSRVAQLELDHKVALASWSHDQRVAADVVTASNNVRESCRSNGAWRAGVAVLDVAAVAGLVLRRWTPRASEVLRRLPWRRG